MKQQFNIEGTSCKSCEVVIERAIQKQYPGTTVDANHSTQTLSVTSEKEVSTQDLAPILEPLGYKVHSAGHKTKSAHGRRIQWNHIGGALILIISFYIIFNETGLLTFSPNASNPTSILGVLAIGLIASLSSCTAVVGGLVAAVSSAVAKEQQNQSPAQKMIPHLVFNAGRILGFAALGMLIGLLGSSLQLSPALNGIFIVLIALLMLIIGINLMGIFSTPIVTMPKWFSHKIHDLAESKNPAGIGLLGALTFFLPCGFTQSMQLYAISLQDPVQAGIVMGLFALGTTPVLLGIGSATTLAKGATLNAFIKIAGAIVIVLGISNGLSGLALLGINLETLYAKTPTNTEYQVDAGRQQVAMRVSSAGAYVPNIISVQKGVPVDWHITGDTFLGCADTLILPAFGVNTRITPGQNLVQFTPDRAGKFTFSCSMGMIRGTLIVNE